MAKKECVIDCDWCGKGIKDTKRDPICVSRDGKDTICITCSEQPASDEQAGEPVHQTPERGAARSYGSCLREGGHN